MNLASIDCVQVKRRQNVCLQLQPLYLYLQTVLVHIAVLKLLSYE